MASRLTVRIKSPVAVIENSLSHVPRTASSELDTKIYKEEYATIYVYISVNSRFAGAIRIGANGDTHGAIGIASVVRRIHEVNSGRKKVHSAVQEGDFAG